ncbi:MAG: hypothetical protein JWM57_2392 [Phycisphaerales bacterium]|nr:hypothetical protein [Phycisphaerales bacterium]
MPTMRIISLAAIALLVGLGSPVFSAEPPRLFASRVGVNVKFSQGEPERDLFLLKDLGVRWVRDNVAWPDIEPDAGKYVGFPRAFANRLAFYKSNNIGVVFGLWYNNAVAYPPTPADPAFDRNPAAYGRYAAEVARLLKASGVRFVIELYNEPHNTMKDLGGKWNGEPPCPWLDQYVAMVNSAVKEVKAVDTTIKLIAGDDMWVLLYRFFEKGLPLELDGLGVHPYVKSWPEFSATEPDTTWTQPVVTVDADRSLTSAIRRLRVAGCSSLGGHNPAIWITEWGWPIGEPIHDRPMTEELLAGLIPRAYLTAADAGVEALLWFSLQDSVDGPMGLTANDGKKRLSYTALKTMVDQLGQTTTIQHVEGADHPTSGLQIYRLAGDGVAPVWAMWNIDGDTAVWAIAEPPGKATIIDAIGKDHAVKLLSPKGVLIGVGRSCVYVKGLNPSAKFSLVRESGFEPAYLFP